MRPVVKFMRLTETAEIPYYATGGAAGMDLCADSDFVIAAGHRVAVPTGLAIDIPYGFEGQVRPRSGLALKKGLSVLNAPGTIDSDYRGEVKVILVNHSLHEVFIEAGDRIAQLVIAPAPQAVIEEVYGMNDTERGVGGFGSTGVK